MSAIKRESFNQSSDMLHDARGQQQDFRQQSYGLRRMAMAGSRGAAKDL